LKGKNMRKHFLMIGTALLLASSAVLAQETVTGAVGGAAVGAVVAGPPGALIGGIIGGTAGATSESARYKYSGTIAVNTRLPAQGVVYKAVPDNYYIASVPAERRHYMYTVVDDAGPNDRVVIVDPAKNYEVVQILQ
jgi:hypothetical protein